MKGHQYYDVAFRALPLSAQLNIEADKLAGQHSSKSKQSTRRINTIKGSGVIPHYAGETINSEYKANIRKFWTHPEIKKNIREGQEWNAEHNLIDWTSHGIDVKNNYNKKLFVVKQIHDWLPLGKLLKYYKQGHPSYCVSCGCEEENRTRFLQCEHRKGRSNILFKELAACYRQHPTKQALQELLQDALGQWLKGEEVVIKHGSSAFNVLVNNQSKAGWEQLFLGHFVHEWKEVQQEHLQKLLDERRKASQSGST